MQSERGTGARLTSQVAGNNDGEPPRGRQHRALPPSTSHESPRQHGTHDSLSTSSSNTMKRIRVPGASTSLGMGSSRRGQKRTCWGIIFLDTLVKQGDRFVAVYNWDADSQQSTFLCMQFTLVKSLKIYMPALVGNCITRNLKAEHLWSPEPSVALSLLPPPSPLTGIVELLLLKRWVVGATGQEGSHLRP